MGEGVLKITFRAVRKEVGQDEKTPRLLPSQSML
jgi:hypothetical protein